MALISFINKKTYEIVDELDDYIYCDYDLRYIIAELNRKGYKTSFSCSGHIEVGLLDYEHREPIEELDEFLEKSKTNSSLHLIRKDDQYFYHKDEKVSTYTYIYFDNNYEFKSIPKGFTLELNECKSNLVKEISFYKDDDYQIRKTDKEISNELNETYDDLKRWVDSLDSVNNK